jgi:modulator of FtsH protease HflC
MKKSDLLAAAGFAVALVLFLILSGAFYTVDQTEQVIITQFGQPVGNPITEPGLHFKIPFVQSVNSLDKRFLEWDGAPVAIPTRDKTYIHVDTFARWRIEDPKTYFVRLHDERSAQSRLEDILGSETRNSIAKHDLIEIVRTDKNRQPLHDESLKGGPTGAIGVLPPIEFGRQKIEEEIKTAAAQKLAGFGIAVLDFRIKRVNYNPDVLDRIYQRMISERLQIAQRFRSEGEGESARIAGQRERDLNEIQSNAYRRVQEIRGEADAKATEIYARAYTQNPQAAEFYVFLKTLETYHKIFSKDSTLVLSTDSDIFTLLKHAATKTTGSPIPLETPAKPLQLVEARYRLLKPVLDHLTLGQDGIQYYAYGVIKAQIFQLTRCTERERYLHLIAFIAHQYYRLHDNQVDVLLTSLQSFHNSALREHKDQCYSATRAAQ